MSGTLDLSAPDPQLDALIDSIKKWRQGLPIDDVTPLDEQQTAALARVLHEEVGQFSVRPEPDPRPSSSGGVDFKDDAKVIPYSGNAGTVPGWKLAGAMSAAGDGNVFYISDTPAGRLLNSPRFQEAVAEAIAPDDLDAGGKRADDLFNGTWTAGVRSKYGVGDVLALNDFVSDKLMREMAYGDVRTITPDAAIDRVFVQTELPALLENPRVTAINGVGVDQLRDILRETGSIEQVNAVVAQASRKLLDGTAYVLDEPGANPKDEDVHVVAVDSTRFFEGSGTDGARLDATGRQVEVIALGPAAKEIRPTEFAVLTIHDTDTAAFQDLGRNVELARVLADAAGKIQAGTQPPFALEDTNGNLVGRFEVTTVAPASAPEPGTARLQIDLGQPAFAQERDVQLSQTILQAADQVEAHAGNGRIELAAPDGKAIGALEVNVAPPQPEPAQRLDDCALTA